LGIYSLCKYNLISKEVIKMPRYDGTGPFGAGPLTGRGLGPCGGGYGRGYGCYGRKFYTKTEEKDLLEDSVQALEEDLKAAKERLAELGSK
jgi:hypothetical protein